MPGEAAMIVLDCTVKGAFHAVDAEGGEVLILDGKPVLKTQKSGGYTIKFSDGREAGVEVTVPAPVEIRQWDLEVEDWNEGEQKEIIEDRSLGLVTREVYFETKKTRIPAGKTELKPWKNIPGLGPEVSGVGYYRAAFTLPIDWGKDKGVLLSIASTNGNSAAIYVNGVKAPAYDFNRKAVDITALVQSGGNTLMVEVSSTLNNRLLARGYHAIISKTVQARLDNFSKPEDAEEGLGPDMLVNLTLPTIHDYGLVGPVTVGFYVLAPLMSQ
jgi:hypothetical protein